MSTRVVYFFRVVWLFISFFPGLLTLFSHAIALARKEQKEEKRSVRDLVGVILKERAPQVLCSQ